MVGSRFRSRATSCEPLSKAALIEADNAVARALLRTLAGRLRVSTKQVEMFALRSLTQRLAGMLLMEDRPKPGEPTPLGGTACGPTARP
jgi:CRP-like cAMP-binding protein